MGLLHLFSANQAPAVFEPNPDHYANMLGMGFTDKKIYKALRVNDNNLERAIEWVFTNLDDEGEEPQQQQQVGTSFAGKE